MGSVNLKIGDGTARFRRRTAFSSAANFLMLFSVITTNVFALYAFTYHHRSTTARGAGGDLSLISEKVKSILREIESSQKKLNQIEKEVLGYEVIDLSSPNIAAELREFLKPQTLPLGRDSKTGITEMVSSVGHSCRKSMDLLSQFMSYRVNAPCPDDWSLAQKLILHGCEPLPRRRCFARTMPKSGIKPFPASLWSNVSEKIYTWSGLGCKTISCLNGKKLNRDCSSCFDIARGYETVRFIRARNKNDFLIDDVLSLGGGGGGGGIRIGFDVGGGGSGTLAARMAERGITVVTATLNVDAPFSDFIAARGLFPLYFSPEGRFPFHDNVFDLVHAGNGLDLGGGKPERVEFLMFDVDRVIRAGGLLWLDNLLFTSGERKLAITGLIDRFGYRKLKWVVGEKKGGGAGAVEVYLSAVLQKPVRV
ncbi:hypothetical protein M569_17397 [Genlisea aurea]|uniref:Methyltransferase type 11 domain-containing protein n=1 Tax=Genlisea aurea TaxID=192259 RepID=S8BZ48_9LAMI|nr:hypothetical protein M569_17397 [Genlisea aurea]